MSGRWDRERDMGTVVLHPDWVITGVPDGTFPSRPPGVAVVASRTLTGATVEVFGRRRPVNLRRGLEPYAQGVVYRLTTEMEDMRICWGETYADALATLLADWGPYERQTAEETLAPTTSMSNPELTP